MTRTRRCDIRRHMCMSCAFINVNFTCENFIVASKQPHVAAYVAKISIRSMSFAQPTGPRFYFSIHFASDIRNNTHAEWKCDALTTFFIILCSYRRHSVTFRRFFVYLIKFITRHEFRNIHMIGSIISGSTYNWYFSVFLFIVHITGNYTFCLQRISNDRLLDLDSGWSSERSLAVAQLSNFWDKIFRQSAGHRLYLCISSHGCPSVALHVVTNKILAEVKVGWVEQQFIWINFFSNFFAPAELSDQYFGHCSLGHNHMWNIASFRILDKHTYLFLITSRKIDTVSRNIVYSIHIYAWMGAISPARQAKWFATHIRYTQQSSHNSNRASAYRICSK